MRRWFSKFVPIVLLAVIVQVLAPIGAFRFVAHAVSDPVFLAANCYDSGDGQSAPTAKRTHGGCCTVCATGIGAAAIIDPPPLNFVVWQGQYQRVVWLAAVDEPPRLRTRAHAQARAPPFIS